MSLDSTYLQFFHCIVVYVLLYMYLRKFQAGNGGPANDFFMVFHYKAAEAAPPQST